MIFSICINICWTPREVLKPELERRGFQHLLRDPSDVNVCENQVFHYYCIKTVGHSKALERILRKVLFFPVLIKARYLRKF